jgi:hypothetical protein
MVARLKKRSTIIALVGGCLASSRVNESVDLIDVSFVLVVSQIHAQFQRWSVLRIGSRHEGGVAVEPSSNFICSSRASEK